MTQQHINNMVGNLNQAPYGIPIGNNPNHRIIQGMNQTPGMIGQGPGMNPNPMIDPRMGGNMQQLMTNRPMNQPGNQFNPNPGGPGPGPNPNQVIPNQPGPNQTGNNNGIGPPLVNATDSDRRKMIQNQLIILIHAAKCQKRADNQDGQVRFYNIFHGSKFQFPF